MIVDGILEKLKNLDFINAYRLIITNSLKVLKLHVFTNTYTSDLL